MTLPADVSAILTQAESWRRDLRGGTMLVPSGPLAGAGLGCPS